MSIRLDLGCGLAKVANHIGVDLKKVKGVDVVADLSQGLPFRSNSIDVIYSSHTIEHLNWAGMWIFLTEIRRVIKEQGEITITFPVCNSYEGFYAGHVNFLSYKWFTDCPEFLKMFAIIKVENTPSQLWSKVKIKFPTLEYDLAKDIFSNLIKETKLTLKARK